MLDRVYYHSAFILRLFFFLTSFRIEHYCYSCRGAVCFWSKPKSRHGREETKCKKKQAVYLTKHMKYKTKQGKQGHNQTTLN